jgi:hypothetical protein
VAKKPLEKPRALITADLQWSANPRDNYRRLIVDTIIELIAKHDPNRLYLLGDLTEEKNEHDAELVNWIVSSLTKLSDLVDVVFLLGNHDFENVNHPFFEFIKHFAGIHWVAQPTIIDGCLFLPHTRDKEYWKEARTPPPSNLIFAHNTFTGARGAHGHSLTGVAQSVFPKGARVISGDVHEPQQFGCITYVGAPYLCDFGDDYQPRMLLLDDGELTSIDLQGPQKRLVKLADVDAPLKGANSGDIVKLEVALETRDVAVWPKIKSNLEKEAADLGWVLNTIVPVVAYDRDTGGAAAKHEVKSDRQYFDSYGKRLGVDKDTLSAGLELMED